MHFVKDTISSSDCDKMSQNNYLQQSELAPRLKKSSKLNRKKGFHIISSSKIYIYIYIYIYIHSKNTFIFQEMKHSSSEIKELLIF